MTQNIDLGTKYTYKPKKEYVEYSHHHDDIYAPK